jgi:hypothetical protein
VVRFRLHNAAAIARLVVGVAASLFIAGCATGPKYGPDSPVTTIVVPVEPIAYAPLVPKSPATVGIYYPETFRGAIAMAGGGASPRYRYEIGAAAVALFDQNAAALFAETVKLPSPPRPNANVVGVDLVLVPSFQPGSGYFLLGVDVFGPDGAHIATTTSSAIETPVPDQGSTSPTGDLSGAAGRFLSERVGDLATTLVLSRDVARWADARGIAWQWPEAPSYTPSPIPPAGVAIVVCFGEGLRSCVATEKSAAVAEALRKLDSTVRIVPADELRRAFYPWFGYADMSDAQAAEWLRRPAVATRAAAIGVRYLVIADKLTTWTQQHGDIGIVAGGLGGGLFGLMWWTQNESGQLRVFDFVTSAEAQGVSHQREDVTFALPAFVVPMPIPIPRAGGDSMPEAIAKQLLPLVTPPR